MERPFGLMIVIVVLSLYLHIEWLALMMAAVMGILMLSTLEFKKPSPAPAGGKGEEILTPVIVQDIGEPPYLYPPNFELRLNPNESLMPRYVSATEGFGKFVRAIVRTARMDDKRDRYRHTKPIRQPTWHEN